VDVDPTVAGRQCSENPKLSRTTFRAFSDADLLDPSRTSERRSRKTRQSARPDVAELYMVPWKLAALRRSLSCKPMIV